ncbi:hypothetical protein B0H14DRAFT_2582732 [Mycena olivaceomarginata]|nr:hypothetical protein B0H14DRAFT_2582732 [Mycena olivaceomarginata]
MRHTTAIFDTPSSTHLGGKFLTKSLLEAGHLFKRFVLPFRQRARLHLGADPRISMSGVFAELPRRSCVHLKCACFLRKWGCDTLGSGQANSPWKRQQETARCGQWTSRVSLQIVRWCDNSSGTSRSRVWASASRQTRYGEVRGTRQAGGRQKLLNSWVVWTRTLAIPAPVPAWKSESGRRLPFQGAYSFGFTAASVSLLWKEERSPFGGGAAAWWMVGGDKRRDKYLVVWPIFWNVGIIDRRAYPRHTAAHGKCVELARCVGAEWGDTEFGLSRSGCVTLTNQHQREERERASTSSGGEHQDKWLQNLLHSGGCLFIQHIAQQKEVEGSNLSWMLVKEMDNALLYTATTFSQDPTATRFSRAFSTEAPIFAWFESPENKERLARFGIGQVGSTKLESNRVFLKQRGYKMFPVVNSCSASSTPPEHTQQARERLSSQKFKRAKSGCGLALRRISWLEGSAVIHICDSCPGVGFESLQKISTPTRQARTVLTGAGLAQSLRNQRRRGSDWFEVVPLRPT